MSHLVAQPHQVQPTPPLPLAPLYPAAATVQGADAVAALYALAEPRQLDEAIDYAARACRATVGEFVAAPSAVGAPGLPWVELAVEFFVPPTGADAFAVEVDRALTRRSLEYAAARRSVQVHPLRLTLLPPGTFHQWRAVWRLDATAPRAGRWAADRRVFESVVHQARVGWREFLPAD